MKKTTKNKSGDVKDTKEATRKKRKRMLVVFLISALVAVSLIVALIYFLTPKVDNTITQSKFSISYTVEPSDDPYIKVLGVTVHMDIEKLSPDKMIIIYKSGISSPILSCVDDKGSDLETVATTDLISIGPIDDSAKSVTYKYDVMVGVTRDYVHTYGDFYEDLLVFSGENVLMSPYLGYEELKKPWNYISSISFKLEHGYDWKAIIPYQEPLSDDCSFFVEKPTWSALSAINKSNYCFGQFEKKDLGIGVSAYFDKAIVDSVPRMSMEVLLSFLDYYNGLFGDLPPDSPLVLLRKSAENNAMILGGVGGKGAAISINLIAADECMTLSSTLFHLYFDSLIKAPNLRYAPNNWLYMGLANHHMQKSGTLLSQEIKDMYSITIVDAPEIAYLNYLYFSIKEPDFLAQNPSLEGSMDQVQGAYYMNLKVPVMIDLINYAISQNAGGELLTALLKNAAEEKDLDIDNFLKAECGSFYEAVLRCFSGNAMIPNYKGFWLDDMVSEEEITYHLSDMDSQFADMFSHGHGYIGYIGFPLILLEPVNFFQDVEAKGVNYSTQEVQDEIKGFSTTLHQYLMQYAMFAKLAGYDTLTSENVRSMYSEKNFKAWMSYCESIGFKE